MARLRLAGLALGVLGAIALTARGKADLGPAFAVPLLAVLLAAGLIAADRTVARPSGTGVRTARLVHRRALDLVPVVPTAGIVLLAVALAGLLGVTGAASTPHLQSLDTPPNPTDGRHIGCLAGGAAQSGPWPGWFYAIPIGVTLFVAGLAATVAIRGLLTRPVEPAAGDAYRRGTATSIVSALGVLVASTLSGAAYFTYSILGQTAVCSSTVPTETRPWLAGLLVVALIAAGYYSVRLVFPTAGRAPERQPALAAR
jgi:hypothetical protein